VKDELDNWITHIQCDDGGSGYTQPCDGVNELKTGNLVFEMTYFGDDPGLQRFEDALSYIENHWRDENTEPGWGYNVDPANYQAMYTLMKGFEYSNIDMIDTDGDGDRDDDWFFQDPPATPYQDFAHVLVDQQEDDGSWTGCAWGDDVLCTVWALLTLEKIAPPPPVIEVPVDVKPTSCSNPLNVKEKGELPVAILGTDDFDVTQVDPASVQLFFDDPGAGVSPLRWSYEDVATPFEPYIGKQDAFDCTTDGPDGYFDLTLKFNAQEVVSMLGDVSDGDVLVLYLSGKLKEEFNGTDIIGEDVIVILK
jgi:hypothetical protein